MDGTVKNLGIVSPTPKDEWESTVQYQRLNIVRHSDASYIAKQANTGIEPNVSTNWQNYWMLLTEDGSMDLTPEQLAALNSGIDITKVEKLNGIESGAQVNAPNTVIDANYVHTDNNFTNTDKTKLEGIENGAEVNAVDSVNGQTGAVVLDSDDIDDSNSNNKFITTAEKTQIETNKNNIEAIDVAYGATLDFTVNPSTYVLTAILKNKNGTALSTQEVDLPLESVVVSGRYDDTTKKIILTLQNGSTIEFSVADLVSGLQSEITPQNKLSADLLENGITNKVFTANDKNTIDDLNQYTNGDVQVLAKKSDLSSKQDKFSYETKTIQTTDWTALSSSTPYTYSATVSATATISANTIVELINDNPILFATYGFAIASVSGQNITVYSIGLPDADVSLKIGIGG